MAAKVNRLPAYNRLPRVHAHAHPALTASLHPRMHPSGRVLNRLRAAATACADTPRFSDVFGFTCKDYRDKKWCEKGGPGSGWHIEWGSLGDWGPLNSTVQNACCACRKPTGAVAPHLQHCSRSTLITGCKRVHLARLIPPSTLSRPDQAPSARTWCPRTSTSGLHFPIAARQRTWDCARSLSPRACARSRAWWAAALPTRQVSCQGHTCARVSS